MSNDSQLATAPVTPGFHRATTLLSETLGVEPRMMVDTLKKQCFPGMSPDAISDAQLAAFISVANSLELNPLIPGMLYAYPSKNGGIVPVAGPDGVLKKLDEGIVEGKLDGFECEVFPPDVTLPPTHAVAKIWRKGSERPSVFTAIFKEWVVGSNPNWASRPRHMIWLRAIKQCARQVIHGVPYDEDDVVIGGMVDVTPKPEDKAPDRPPPPPRQKKGAATVAENKAIEAEIVPPKTEPAKEAPPAQQEPTKEQQTQAEKDAEAAKAKAAAPTPPATGRAFIKPDEVLDGLICEVKAITPVVGNTAGGGKEGVVGATVSGDYNGAIYHFGGGTLNAAKDTCTPNAPWAVGAKVKLSILGKQWPAGNGRPAILRAMVEAVEAVADEQPVEQF